MQRREIRYQGRVQGVGFRATARSIAHRHAVSGWVRNEPDGSVRMQIQGAPDEINACLTDLARRMDGYIKAAEERELAVDDGESGFEIRR